MASHLHFGACWHPLMKLKQSSTLIFTRMTNYPALADFRTFNVDGVKRVLLLLWDIIKIELESFLERTNLYGSYQEEMTDRCKSSGIRLSFNKQEA
eukprot:scaffold137365_cov50-Attheya_sp.AAC.2